MLNRSFLGTNKSSGFLNYRQFGHLDGMLDRPDILHILSSCKWFLITKKQESQLKIFGSMKAALVKTKTSKSTPLLSQIFNSLPML